MLYLLKQKFIVVDNPKLEKFNTPSVSVMFKDLFCYNLNDVLKKLCKNLKVFSFYDYLYFEVWFLLVEFVLVNNVMV